MRIALAGLCLLAVTAADADPIFSEQDVQIAGDLREQGLASELAY